MAPTIPIGRVYSEQFQQQEAAAKERIREQISETILPPIKDYIEEAKGMTADRWRKFLKTPEGEAAQAAYSASQKQILAAVEAYKGLPTTTYQLGALPPAVQRAIETQQQRIDPAILERNIRLQQETSDKIKQFVGQQVSKIPKSYYPQVYVQDVPGETVKFAIGAKGEERALRRLAIGIPALTGELEGERLEDFTKRAVREVELREEAARKAIEPQFVEREEQIYSQLGIPSQQEITDVTSGFGEEISSRYQDLVNKGEISVEEAQIAAEQEYNQRANEYLENVNKQAALQIQAYMMTPEGKEYQRQYSAAYQKQLPLGFGVKKATAQLFPKTSLGFIGTVAASPLIVKGGAAAFKGLGAATAAVGSTKAGAVGLKLWSGALVAEAYNPFQIADVPLLRKGAVFRPELSKERRIFSGTVGALAAGSLIIPQAGLGYSRVKRTPGKITFLSPEKVPKSLKVGRPPIKKAVIYTGQTIKYARQKQLLLRPAFFKKPIRIGLPFGEVSRTGKLTARITIGAKETSKIPIFGAKKAGYSSDYFIFPEKVKVAEFTGKAQFIPATTTQRIARLIPLKSQFYKAKEFIGFQGAKTAEQQFIDLFSKSDISKGAFFGGPAKGDIYISGEGYFKSKAGKKFVTRGEQLIGKMKGRKIYKSSFETDPFVRLQVAKKGLVPKVNRFETQFYSRPARVEETLWRVPGPKSKTKYLVIEGKRIYQAVPKGDFPKQKIVELIPTRQTLRPDEKSIFYTYTDWRRLPKQKDILAKGIKKVEQTIKPSSLFTDKAGRVSMGTPFELFGRKADSALQLVEPSTPSTLAKSITGLTTSQRYGVAGSIATRAIPSPVTTLLGTATGTSQFLLPATATRLGLRETTIQRQLRLQREKSRQRFEFRERPVVRQRFVTRSTQRSALLTTTRADVRTDTRQLTRPDTRLRTRFNLRPTLLPRALPELEPNPFKIKQKKRKRQAFITLVRRKGKFTPIGAPTTRGRALKRGARVARQTLAASFKIEPVRGKSIFAATDIKFTPSPEIFRRPKRGGRAIIGSPIFIQRGGRERAFEPGRRLASPGERREIQFFRRGN